MPSILDTDTMESIPPEKLFKKSDIKQLFKSCNHILEDELWGNRYGYHSCHIYISDCRDLAEKEKITIKKAHSILRKKWEEENPEEAKREFDSKMNWKKEHTRNFRIIFGIARRNGYFIEFNKTRPDTFEIIKNNKPIARICLF